MARPKPSIGESIDTEESVDTGESIEAGVGIPTGEGIPAGVGIQIGEDIRIGEDIQSMGVVAVAVMAYGHGNNGTCPLTCAVLPRANPSVCAGSSWAQPIPSAKVLLNWLRPY